MRKLNWVAILLTALVTGVATIGAGVTLDRLRAQEPHLVYSTSDTIPFTGQDQVVAIYQVSVTNDGRKAVEDVASHIHIPGGTIEQWHLSADASLAYSDSVVDDALVLRFPGLNPSEEVQVSVLATALTQLPDRPTVSLRAKGISGVEKPPRKEEFGYWWSVLAALIGAMAGLVSLQALRSQWHLEERTKEREERAKERAEARRGRHHGDQRRVLAYLCGIHGLAEQAGHYLARRSKTSYWAEADRLASLAIASNNPEITEKVKATLRDLLKYATISETSAGLILYNLARIAAVEGKVDEMKQHLEKASAREPNLVATRVKLDPVFKQTP